MDDALIRTALKRKLHRLYNGDSRTLIVDELGLQHGAARIDIAIINNIFHGYEIKSERDSLYRLPKQIRIYNSVLDRVTLVVTARHVDRSTLMVPEWWGISVAEQHSEGAIKITEWRSASDNPSIDLLGIAKLLWREEALQLLEECGGADGVRSKPRSQIYARITECIDPCILRSRVHEQLMARITLKADT